MKISTNSKLAVNKPKWIDFNAGSLVENDLIVYCRTIYSFCYQVASGRRVNNELNGFREIAIFKSGVTL